MPVPFFCNKKQNNFTELYLLAIVYGYIKKLVVTESEPPFLSWSHLLIKLPVLRSRNYLFSALAPPLSLISAPAPAPAQAPAIYCHLKVKTVL